MYVSMSMRTDVVLVALEQALYASQPDSDNRLTHHSDCGPRIARDPRRANVCPGSTTTGCWSPSATSRLPDACQSDRMPARNGGVSYAFARTAFACSCIPASSLVEVDAALFVLAKPSGLLTH